MDVLDKDSMRAISAETRQSIIKSLSKRPHTASELADALGKHVTTTAEHLHVLEKAGIVRRRESTNKWVYYELTEKGARLMKPAYSWMITLALSVLSLGVGLYEIFFVRFEATRYAISEAAAAASTTEVSAANMYIGVAALLIALALFWYTMKLRSQ